MVFQPTQLRQTSSSPVRHRQPGLGRAQAEEWFINPTLHSRKRGFGERVAGNHLNVITNKSTANNKTTTTVCLLIRKQPKIIKMSLSTGIAIGRVPERRSQYSTTNTGHHFTRPFFLGNCMFPLVSLATICKAWGGGPGGGNRIINCQHGICFRFGCFNWLTDDYRLLEWGIVIGLVMNYDWGHVIREMYIFS